ncbi:MAG TPA: glycosyltransferase family 2 protein [Thermoanaerobaculia bacterium]|jgi:dolichol-phosphate mannosyltransferase/undecaprenyl-phosphate 4-deoxy-4-formamido-L-arabinose transferase|nr:glycosyltransferase family 2 protein [Thermoanaerobaculia bacterium]
MLVSIVIPVYDSPVLEELADSIEAVFRTRPEDDYEIVFVDDRSPDPRIWPTLMRLAGERERVKAVQLTRNFGQQAATLCGLREANGDVVVTLDDDLQHDPRDIPKLLAHADRDIVIGQFERKRHSLTRRTSSRIKGFFDRILIGKPRGIQLSSFRLLGRTVVDGILSIRTPHPFLPALMFHVSKDVVGVPVSHGARREGRSGYTFRKLFRVFSNLLFNNSSFLLRLVGVVGISFAGLSFLLAGVVIYRKIVHSVNVQGWTSLFATLLLIGGLLLVSLGVVGEYLLRIIESSENRPTYLVRRRLGFPPEAKEPR